MSESSWYKEVSGADTSLEQGDIIEDCMILMPNDEDYNTLDTLVNTQGESESVEMNFIKGSFIILSQSCDLANDKIDSVILCLIKPFEETAIKFPDLILKSSKQRKSLLEGNIPEYHLLNKVKLTNSSEEKYYCVWFHDVYSVPKGYLEKVIRGKQRQRLVSPYKENLSQAFARYFMRIGLPSGITGEKLTEYVSQHPEITQVPSATSRSPATPPVPAGPSAPACTPAPV